MLLMVFLGFGTNPKFYPEMNEKILPLLKRVSKNFLIVTSGWKGEALWLRRFLVQVGNVPGHNVLVEPEARTTYENIRFVFREVVGLLWLIDKIIFIGEAANEKEVLWLAPRLFERTIRGAIKEDDVSENLPRMEFFPLHLLSEEKKKRKRKKSFWQKWNFISLCLLKWLAY